MSKPARRGEHRVGGRRCRGPGRDVMTLGLGVVTAVGRVGQRVRSHHHCGLPDARLAVSSPIPARELISARRVVVLDVVAGVLRAAHRGDRVVLAGVLGHHPSAVGHDGLRLPVGVVDDDLDKQSRRTVLGGDLGAGGLRARQRARQGHGVAGDGGDRVGGERCRPGRAESEGLADVPVIRRAAELGGGRRGSRARAGARRVDGDRRRPLPGIGAQRGRVWLRTPGMCLADAPVGVQDTEGELAGLRSAGARSGPHLRSYVLDAVVVLARHLIVVLRVDDLPVDMQLPAHRCSDVHQRARDRAGGIGQLDLASRQGIVDRHVIAGRGAADPLRPGPVRVRQSHIEGARGGGLAQPWRFHVVTVQVYSSPSVRAGPAVGDRLRPIGSDPAAVPHRRTRQPVTDDDVVRGLRLVPGAVLRIPPELRCAAHRQRDRLVVHGEVRRRERRVVPSSTGIVVWLSAADAPPASARTPVHAPAATLKILPTPDLRHISPDALSPQVRCGRMTNGTRPGPFRGLNVSCLFRSSTPPSHRRSIRISQIRPLSSDSWRTAGSGGYHCSAGPGAHVLPSSQAAKINSCADRGRFCANTTYACAGLTVCASVVAGTRAPDRRRDGRCEYEQPLCARS